MSQKLRILITGFGPFPGAPFNPTMPLVKRLTQLRRPAFADVELIGHIFHVTYATVDRQLPELIAKYRPQALLSFVTSGTCVLRRPVTIRPRGVEQLAQPPGLRDVSSSTTSTSSRRISLPSG